MLKLLRVSSTKNKYFEMLLLSFQITLFKCIARIILCSVLLESDFPQTVGTCLLYDGVPLVCILKIDNHQNKINIKTLTQLKLQVTVYIFLFTWTFKCFNFLKSKFLQGESSRFAEHLHLQKLEFQMCVCVFFHFYSDKTVTFYQFYLDWSLFLECPSVHV